ncbi:beta strand repeat-containing protein [Luteolibacter marinus]|uniref:beta strand repeat-containing protein n=1 Tax=Luteolibacter marinus TaxID=2776705 RepID=UPI001865F9C6|nr:autotransporter-associated beta strand repeat-containing protein [Luteolibacter marinus]
MKTTQSRIDSYPATRMFKRTSLIAALIATAHSTAYAAGVWDGGIGKFEEPTNWDNDTVPVGINTNVSNGGTILFDATTGARTTNDILAGTVAGTGTWTMSGGTLSMVGGWMRLGTVAGGFGTFNLSGGTLNTVGQKNIGEAPGGTGVVNMSGTGNWTNAGGDSIAIGGRSSAAAAGNGTLNMSGDAIINNNTEFRIGTGTGSIGTAIMNGGTINNAGWFVVGRSSGTGSLTMTAGAINKTGGGDFIVGSLSGQGTVNHSGGTISTNGARTLLGEGTGSNVYNLSGTGVANFSQLTLSFAGTANGTFNLNGNTTNRGELTATTINKLGTGTGIFNFNGGRLKAGAANATFMQGLNRANVRNEGALINSNTFNIAIAQNLLHSDIGGDAAVDGGLTKSGTGDLTLAGANTFTGDTVITEGTLTLNNANALGGSALNYNNQGGTLSFGTLTAATFGGLKGSQNLALTNVTPAAVTLTLGNNNANNTYAGVLSGGGSLVKIGTGVQTLTGSNTYTGTTSINAGAISVNDITNLPNSGTGTTVAAGAVLAAPTTTDIAAFRASLGNVTFNAGSFIGVDTSAGDFTYAGNIGDTAYANNPGFAKVGTNNLTLTGNNTYTGGTRVSGGTLIVGSANALGAAGNSLTTGVGGTYDFNGFAVTQDSLILSGGVVNSTNGASALSLSSTANAINVTGTYAFANTAVTANVPINLTGATGGHIVKSTTFGNPVIAGDINLGGQNRTIALADTGGDAFPEMTLSGVISNGSLTLDNTLNGISAQEWGSLSLTGANTYGGATNITYGRLEITNADSLGSSATGTNIGPNGTLALGGSGQVINPGITVAEPLSINRTVAGTYGLIAVQSTSGNNFLTGDISLDATAEFNVTGGALDLSGVISETDASGLTKSGGAVMSLSAANTYTGETLVTGGELLLYNDNALGDTLNGARVTGGRIALGGAVTITDEFATINGNGGNLGGAIQAAAFSEATWAGDIILGSVDAAAVRIGAQDGGILNVEGVIQNGTGALLDVSGLAGTGTVVLKATNTYNGATNVIRGNLVVDGGSITSGAAVGVGGNGGGEQTSCTVQNGGSIFADTLVIAPNNVPQNGNWFQSDGLVSTKAWFIIGSDGTGTANGVMTGGTLDVKTVAAPEGQSFEIGTFGAVSGTFTMSGSSAVNLQNNAFVVLGAQANSGTNTFNQDGGTVTYYTDGGTTLGGNRMLILGAGTSTANCTYNLNGGTLTVPGVTRESTGGSGSGVLNFNGGLLVPTGSSATFVTALTRANVRDGGAMIDTAGFDVTITQALEHSDVDGDAAVDGGLTKLGAGTLVLTADNTYTGDTVIDQGTLSLQSAIALDDLSSLRMDSGALLNLDHAGMEAVYRFYVDDVPLAAGTYVASGTETGGQIGSTLITGTGALVVANDGTSTPFEDWATTTKGLAGAAALPGADPDNDKLENLLEFILGGEPNPANPGSNNLGGLAATVEASGGNHVFSFRRSQISATQPGLTIVYEYSTGLGVFNPATDVGTVSAPFVDFYGPGIDKIEVTIPDTVADPNGSLFVRMNATLAE